MNFKDADLPALRELEAAVMTEWKTHPDITNYTVGRVYDALHQQYRARLRSRELKPAALEGAEREIFDVLQKVCEKLLATGAAPLPGLPNSNTKPITLEQLVDYLRELMRSVERHTQSGGRYAYLTFLREFIPAK
jgi:hypothetical protein